jgi:hypothetical protein
MYYVVYVCLIFITKLSIINGNLKFLKNMTENIEYFIHTLILHAKINRKP